MSEKVYKVAVLGSGPGGYVAAIRAAQLGASVAVIEERELGGTCLNRGCIPSKALIESARAFKIAKNAADFGVNLENPKPDFKAVRQRQAKILETLRGGIAGLFKRSKIDVITGRGRLVDKNNIAVENPDGETTVTAEKIILATGSEPVKPKGFDFDGKKIITSDHALSLDALPKNVLIIGGGYIGCEFAGIFNSFGCQVTVVEALSRLLPGLDVDISAELIKAFKKAKIKVHLDTKCESLEKSARKVKAKLSGADEISVDAVLFSVGRAINTRKIGLDKVGVELEKGAVKIDERCRTNVPNIFAIGDITAKIQLAHLASKQGMVAAECAMGRDSKIDYRVVPACVFTDPEIGTVGMTEDEAKKAGIEVKSSKFPFRALGKAHALGEIDGYTKIIADAKTGEVIGVHIIGAHATELIAEAALAMKLEATVGEISDTIHAHPTMAEGMMESAAAWLGHAVHA